MENYFEDELDEIVSKLLSGEITNESAEKLAREAAKTTIENNPEKLRRNLSGTLEYLPTESFLEYSIEGSCMYIDSISSGQEKQGGCSILLLEAEKMARHHNIGHLELEVLETNSAMEIYEGKGYSEVKRNYAEPGQGALVTMRKEIYNIS